MCVSALAAGIYRTSGVFLLLILTSISERRLTVDNLFVLLMSVSGVILILQPWLTKTWPDEKVRPHSACTHLSSPGTPAI